MKKVIRIIVQDWTGDKVNKEIYRNYEVDTEMLEPEFNIADMIDTLLNTEDKF